MGSQEVPAIPVILLMIALSCFIYIFLIPDYSEYDNYAPNITEVQEVEVESELREIVGLVIIGVVLITFVSVVLIYNYRIQKKYPEPSPAPEEDSTERND